MPAHHIFLIAHLFGLALGLGGASTIDSIFLVASRRGQVTRELVEVVHTAAALIAGAMLLLAVSGAAFFLVGVEATPKFWAKMVIVGIACLNGLAAHRLVFPLIDTAVAAGTGRLQLRPWPARMVAASAATSTVSWSSALILGAWHGLKMGIVPILAAYVGVLTAAVLASAIVAPRVFVFAPDGLRRRRVRSLRDLRQLPLEIAYAVALTIAGAALAIAARLNGRMALTGTGTAERFATATDASQAGWLSRDDGWGWPDDGGGEPDGRLRQGLFPHDDRQYPFDPFRVPDYNIDDFDSEPERRRTG